jgi:hypothetical protein
MFVSIFHRAFEQNPQYVAKFHLTDEMQKMTIKNALEVIFEHTQNGVKYHSWLLSNPNVVKKGIKAYTGDGARSTSMGDIMAVFTSDTDRGQWFEVKAVGFEDIGFEKAKELLKKGRGF